MLGGSAPGEQGVTAPTFGIETVEAIHGCTHVRKAVVCVLGVTLCRAWLGACLEASLQAAAELPGM